MLIVGVVPFFNGNFHAEQLLALRAVGGALCAEPGAWNIAGWTLVLGGMFIAAWSTYGFETAICYTSEFKNPATDTFKAIFYSGLLCLVLFILVPITFQGYLGLEGMLERRHGRRHRRRRTPWARWWRAAARSSTSCSCS